MKKCNADDHPYCTHRVQEGEAVCAVGHLQKLASMASDVGQKSAVLAGSVSTITRIPFLRRIAGDPKSLLHPSDINRTLAEGATLFRPTVPAEPAVASNLHLHFSGYDPRAAGGRQMLRLELLGAFPLAKSISQIEVQLRSDLIAPNLSKHRFVRTLSGQWRPLLIAFSSKNKEYGQYQMEVTLTHMIGDTSQRRWTCSTIILVPPADTSLTEIHRVFLASHKNLKVLADDGSIAKLSGLNSYAQGNMDIEISARNAALTQVELSAPLGKHEIAMGTIAWDEELIEEAIEEHLAVSQKITPGKAIAKTIAAPQLNAKLQTSTSTSASLISKAAQIRLLALDEWVLGRMELQYPSADILLAHRDHSVAENAKLTRRISARHAIIRRTNAGLGAEIMDVSRYGVLLNGVALEKNQPAPLKPGMQIEFCASVKGIACLRVTAILPHLVILQRSDADAVNEFFYLLTPEIQPGEFPQTLPVALPDSLPQLFHHDGNFWHINTHTKQQTVLDPAASLNKLQHIQSGTRYVNEAYEKLHDGSTI